MASRSNPASHPARCGAQFPWCLGSPELAFLRVHRIVLTQSARNYHGSSFFVVRPKKAHKTPLSDRRAYAETFGWAVVGTPASRVSEKLSSTRRARVLSFCCLLGAPSSTRAVLLNNCTFLLSGSWNRGSLYFALGTRPLRIPHAKCFLRVSFQSNKKPSKRRYTTA